MSTRADERTRLHGRWLVIARALWIALAAPMVVISIGFVPLHRAQLEDLFARDAVALAQLGLSVELAVGFRIATGLVLLSGSIALALLVFRQRSDDWLALL